MQRHQCLRTLLLVVAIAIGSRDDALAQQWTCYADTTMPEGELGTGDCLPDFTNPDPHIPTATSPLYRIPVVFHLILRDSLGTGDLPDDSLFAQINRMNEDFLAVPGTPGSTGYNTRIMYFLATLDSLGNQTTGIERVVSQIWYDSATVVYNVPRVQEELPSVGV